MATILQPTSSGIDESKEDFYRRFIDHSIQQGDHETTEVDMNTVRKMLFEISKAGMLIPMQTIVEKFGNDILLEKDDSGNYPIHWICFHGHMAILQYFLQIGADLHLQSDNEIKNYPIHWACVKGHISVIDLLLHNNISIDARDAKNCTPLISAAQYGQTMLVGYLTGKGADIFARDHEGDTALHWAGFKGHSELMRLLVYSGLNPSQKDKFGQTPLHLSCINGDLTAVQALCELDGVEIDEPDSKGKTPVMLAKGRKRTQVVRYLTELISKRKTYAWVPKIDAKSIFFGPPGQNKAAFYFVLFTMLLMAYPVYFLKIIPYTWHDLQYTHTLFMLLNIPLWVCFYYACVIDPGFIPKNTEGYHSAIQQVKHHSDWQGGNPLKRLCHTCRIVKPLRAKHCRFCKQCVKNFDHHCPYINNCVGYYNRGWFVSFVWLTALLLGFSFYFSYYMLTNFGTDYIIIVCSLELIFFVVITVIMSMSIVYHITRNMTTNEFANYKRYDYLMDGRGQFYNPFDLGVVKNIMEFFHLTKPPREDSVEFLNYQIV